MFSRTRGKHRRSQHRGRTAVTLLSVALFGISTLTFGQSASAAPGDVTITLSPGWDGTGFDPTSGARLSDACPATLPNGSPADASAHDGKVCTNDSASVKIAYTVESNNGSAQISKLLTFTLPANSGATWDSSDLNFCSDKPASSNISADGLTLNCLLAWDGTKSLSGFLNMALNVSTQAKNGLQFAPTLHINDGSADQTVSPFTVIAQPRVNLTKDIKVVSVGPNNTQRVRVHVGGFITSYTPKGYSPLTGGISFTDDLSGMPAGTVLETPGNCYVQPAVSALAVAPGAEGTWSCSQAAPGGDVSISITGARTDGVGSGASGSGIPVVAGDYYLDVPNASLPTGAAVAVTDQLKQFDPWTTAADGSTQVSNYGTDFEPGGAPGNSCANPANNDNCASVDMLATAQTSGGDPFIGKGLVLPHDPYKWIETGEKFSAQVVMGPSDSPPKTNVVMCDKFDATKEQLDTSTAPTVTSGSPVPGYTVEYSAQPFGGAADADCNSGTWFTDPAQAGGPSAITAVRFTFPGAWPTTGDVLTANIPMVNVDQNPDRGIADYAWIWYPNGKVTHQGSSATYDSTPNAITVSKFAVDGQDRPVGSTVGGATLRYLIQPGYTSWANIPAVLTVKDQLPSCELSPVLEPGSAAIWTMTVEKPGDPGPDGVWCTSDDVAGPLLKFVSTPLTDASAAPIHYTVTVDAAIRDNTVLTNSATMSVPNNNQSVDGVRPAARSDVDVRARGIQTVSMQKFTDAPVVQVGDPIGFTLQYSNTSNADAGRTQWIDRVPTVGDRGTVLSGTLRPATATLLGDQTNLTLEYTKAAGVVDDPADASNGPGGSTVWCTSATAGGQCPSSLGEVTAFRLTFTDLLPDEIGALHFTATPTGDANGDKIFNDVGLGRAETLSKPVPRSNMVEVDVIGSSIGDRVWNDLNSNGVQDPGELGMPGVAVELRDSAGAAVATATTDANGNYTFPNLRAGTYSVDVVAGTLPAGAVATYDLDNGTTNPNGDSGKFALASATSRTDVDFGYLVVNPSVSITKTADQASYKSVGDALTDTVVVTNTGNVLLSPVVVTDVVSPGTPAATSVAVDCGGTTSLAPGASVTCHTAAYAVTQVDLDRGSVTDTASVDAAPPSGPHVSDKSSATVSTASGSQTASLSVVKSTPQVTYRVAGDRIDYTITVTNTGNQTLHGLVVKDVQAAPAGELTSGPTCPTDTIAPNQVVKCTGIYMITKTDVDHGDVTDTAQATALTPSDAPVPSNVAHLTIDLLIAGPPTTTHNPHLATTGVPVAGIVGIGLLLLLAGCGLVVLTTRRRHA